MARFLRGPELLGMIIGMLAEKRSWDVCELAVDLTGLTHFEHPKVDKLVICTSYYIGDWKCIDDRPTWVVTDPISPHRIKFNRHWALGD